MGSTYYPVRGVGGRGRVCLSSASSLFPFAHLLACEAFIVRDTPDAKERI